MPVIDGTKEKRSIIFLMINRIISSVLIDYKKGLKYPCYNDIWVIGSAAVGNSCFSCITGESQATDDFEIDSAVKNVNIKLAKDILMIWTQLKLQNSLMMTDMKLIRI